MSATTLETSLAAVSRSGQAQAKINLFLSVRGPRSDGFHEIRSLVTGIDLCDRLQCRRRLERGIELSCSGAAPQGEDNLAYRAARALARHVGRDPSIHIVLTKVIPIGAGLGGGSSDAAGTLRLCNDLWECGLHQSELAAIGAKLGSDVPLFFSLPTALISGRGEQVEPVTLEWSGWVLLVMVQTMVSTQAVYQQWRSSDRGRVGSDEMERAILHARTADEIMPWLSNDLEPAVLRVAPPVARVFGELNRTRWAPMRITGAGSTLYRLFDDKEAACRAAREIEDLQLGVGTSVVAASAEPGPIEH